MKEKRRQIKLSWTEGTITMIKELAEKSGKPRQHGAITEALVVGNVKKVQGYIALGEMRFVANLIGLLEQGKTSKCEEELRSLYSRIVEK